MKKIPAMVIAMIFLLCVPVYADDMDYAENAVYAENGPTDAAVSDYRVSFDYQIAVPVDARTRGLDPVYKVESSYADDNGEIWYVMAGPRKTVLRESECTVQNYIDTDTDSLIRKQVVSAAIEKLGCPYAYGRSGPLLFDCSGLVQYCMNAVGVTVPRSSYSICAMDTKISPDQLRAGDILAAPGHVGIYIGNGCFIHAQDHKNGVVTDFLDIYNANSYKDFIYYINILD